MEAVKTSSEDRRVFYYYSGYDAKHTRKVLAGVVSTDKIEVGEAGCFTGIKSKLIEVPLASGQVVFVIDPGVRADVFTKVKGKEVALEKATGIRQLPGGKTADIGKTLAFIIPIPAGEEGIGRLFVQEVEAYLRTKGYPDKPKKLKKLPKAPKANEEPNQRA